MTMYILLMTLLSTVTMTSTSGIRGGATIGIDGIVWGDATDGANGDIGDIALGASIATVGSTDVQLGSHERGRITDDPNVYRNLH